MRHFQDVFLGCGALICVLPVVAVGGVLTGLSLYKRAIDLLIFFGINEINIQNETKYMCLLNFFILMLNFL